MRHLITVIVLFACHTTVQANSQQYALLTASTITVTPYAISDQVISHQMLLSTASGRVWLTAMSDRLKYHMPDKQVRDDFLSTVHYEATRAGLDPQLILSIIQVESDFKKYAISHAGALGYMQIMPFWIETIGSKDHNLFHLRINLRYGCMIFRHYLDIEKGNYFRALGRYNGSLGQSAYPQLVFKAWRTRWSYPSQT